MEVERIQLIETGKKPQDFNSTCEEILSRSESMEGAMGALGFAVLEMFRRGGLDEASVRAIHEKMDHYFMNPSNEECNAICKMVEIRLKTDRRADNSLWYK